MIYLLFILFYFRNFLGSRRNNFIAYSSNSPSVGPTWYHSSNKVASVKEWRLGCIYKLVWISFNTFPEKAPILLQPFMVIHTRSLKLNNEKYLEDRLHGKIFLLQNVLVFPSKAINNKKKEQHDLKKMLMVKNS